MGVLYSSTRVVRDDAHRSKGACIDPWRLVSRRSHDESSSRLRASRLCACCPVILALLSRQRTRCTAAAHHLSLASCLPAAQAPVDGTWSAFAPQNSGDAVSRDSKEDGVDQPTLTGEMSTSSVKVRECIPRQVPPCRRCLRWVGVVVAGWRCMWAGRLWTSAPRIPDMTLSSPYRVLAVAV
jgi:hypothetical protein